MKRKLLTSVCTAIAAFVSAGGMVNAECTAVESINPVQIKTRLDDKKWGGSASATCKCANGVCKPVSCDVTGNATYEDAKKALKAAIEAKIKAENGKLDGEISFTIEFKF